jgi:ribosome-associated translation inhibitor RaiA
VEIIFQAHHATISDRMRARAERAVTKAAQRLGRVVAAVVRFEGDGPTRRVEIVLRSPRHRHLVAEGRARSYYGPALAAAVDRLIAQIPKKDGAPRSRTRPAARRPRVAARDLAEV